MGTLSIWHLLFLVVLGLPGFLPLLIKPSGPNRFGPPASPVKFSQAFSLCMRKYVDFTGRARRSEYWWFYLATFLISFVISFVVSLVATASHISVPPIKFLVTLFFLMPTLAVGVRRLHDINRTGWWLLLLLTGFGAIGLIVLLIWSSRKDDEVIAQVFE
jgi:uncharacterized membrane protein YhaH (DUF805 family)